MLIVDDSGVNRRMLTRLLRGRCKLSVESEDGLQAVEQVTKSMERFEPFHAVIMDYQMPDMDGPSAASMMRKIGYTGIIIGCTGKTEGKDIDYFLRCGANRVLTKPIDLHELDQILFGK